METYLLLHVPTLVLGLGIVGVTTGLAVLGLVVVRRSVELRTLESHHDVAGFILAVVGVVYAVLLAFVVVITWQQFEDARSAADREAAMVGTLYRDALSLPDGGADIRIALKGYATSVVQQEWPEMAAHHRENRRTDERLNRVWDALRAARPRSQTESVFYGEAAKRLHDATELRRTRILSSGAQLPSPLWIVLIVGAAISVGFTYFFGVRSLLAQLLMVSALASIIGLVLFLILSLDLPFTGDIGVGPSAMKDVMAEFSHY